MAETPKKYPYLKTAGELKRALEKIPDDTPLAIYDHGEGWGLKPLIIATHGWRTLDHNGFVAEDDPSLKEKNRRPHQAVPKRLPTPVCVIEPGCAFTPPR